MAEEQKYDVHTRVGLLFIGGCLLIGFLTASIVPLSANLVGLIGSPRLTVEGSRIQLQDVFVFGLLGGMAGLANGVLLSINLKLWWIGALIAIVPCGLFGGVAAAITRHPYTPMMAAFVFWWIPIAIVLFCGMLRKFVWVRYQRPVKKGAK